MKGNLETIEVYSAITDLKIARMLYSSDKEEAARDGVRAAIQKLEGWLVREELDDKSIMCACGHEKWFHGGPVAGRCVVMHCGCKGFDRPVVEPEDVCACGHARWFHTPGVGCMVQLCGCRANVRRGYESEGVGGEADGAPRG